MNQKDNMEVNQLLNAIIEVSQAVARIPCAPQDKNETLQKITDLFSSYAAVSQAFANVTGSSQSREQTPLLKVAEAGCSNTSGESQDLRKVEEKIQSMDDRFCTIERKISKLESEEPTSDIKSEILSQMRTIGQTQDSLYNKVTNLENMSNGLEVLENQIKEISDLVEEERSSFSNELVKIHQEIAKVQDHDSKKIDAFSAKAVSATNKVLQFKNVALNFQDCYDQHTSTFRTKVLGLYFFSTSINTNSKGVFLAAIIHNDKEVALFGASGQKDIQTGTSAVLWLKPGDTVCVRIRDTHQTLVEIGGGFSNFIGYRIG